MREVPSHPYLMITRTGELYYKATMQKIKVHTNHSYSAPGPASYVNNGKCMVTVSIARLMYEAYVLEGILERCERITFSDGDDTNVDPSNLERNRTRNKRTARKVYSGDFDNWMGINSVYV